MTVFQRVNKICKNILNTSAPPIYVSPTESDRFSTFQYVLSSTSAIFNLTRTREPMGLFPTLSFHETTDYNEGTRNAQ